jgi:hypothetical protein
MTSGIKWHYYIVLGERPAIPDQDFYGVDRGGVVSCQTMGGHGAKVATGDRLDRLGSLIRLPLGRLGWVALVGSRMLPLD